MICWVMVNKMVFKKKPATPEDMTDEMGDAPSPSESQTTEDRLHQLEMQIATKLSDEETRAKQIRESVDINSVLDLLAEHINNSEQPMNTYYNILYELSRRLK